MLAGMVENPSLDNPVTNPAAAIKRRNVVLARMAQLHYITQAHAVAVGKQGLGLHLHPAADRLHQRLGQERRVLL